MDTFQAWFDLLEVMFVYLPITLGLILSIGGLSIKLIRFIGPNTFSTIATNALIWIWAVGSAYFFINGIVDIIF